MRYLRIKNWSQFQHYKHRAPTWIKLHQSLLTNYEFTRLQDASKAHLLMLWLLASQHNNKIPADPQWLSRALFATGPVDLDELLSAGFIEAYDDASVPLAERMQNGGTEKSREEYREEESREEIRVIGESEQQQRANPESASLLDDLFAVQAISTEQAFDDAIDPDETMFELCWQEYPARAGGNSKADARKAFLARLKAGALVDDLLAGTRRYAAYCEAMGMTGTQYVKQAATFFGPGKHYEDAFEIPAGKRGKPAPQQFEYSPTTEVPSFLRGRKELPPNPDPGF